jgi:hypothetical protein
MGQIEQAAHNLQEAKHHYRLAKNLLDTLRSRVRGEDLRISFMSNRLEVYENLVEICLEPTSTPELRSEGWTHVEQTKSRNLFELVARQLDPAGENHETSGFTSQIVELREQLNWFYPRIEVEQLGQVPTSDKRPLTLQRLAEEHERKLLKAFREADTVEAVTSSARVTEPVSLDALRTTLGPDTTLIEYFRLRDRILAFVVTGNGLEITPITSPARIGQALRMLQFQLSKFRLDRG